MSNIQEEIREMLISEGVDTLTSEGLSNKIAERFKGNGTVIAEDSIKKLADKIGESITEKTKPKELDIAGIAKKYRKR